MILHAFERRFDFDAHLRRLEEPLITDYGFTWVEAVTLFSTVPIISSQECLGLVHASKMRPCSPQLMQEPVFSLCLNSAEDNFCLALSHESFFFCSCGGSFRFCPCVERP